VPIAAMDLVPRTIGDWDPVSALVASVRGLTQGYPSSGSWLLDHAEVAMLSWSVLLLLIFVPLALRRFNRRLAA
jgi:ABC-2 type transport system permease protein